MTDTVSMVSPQGEVREVEASPAALVPLMIRGWQQKQEEVKPDVSSTDARNTDLLR